MFVHQSCIQSVGKHLNNYYIFLKKTISNLFTLNYIMTLFAKNHIKVCYITIIGILKTLIISSLEH